MPLEPKIIHLPRHTHLHTHKGETIHPTLVINGFSGASLIGDESRVIIDAGDRDGRQPLFHLRLGRVAYYQLLEALTAAGEVFK